MFRKLDQKRKSAHVVDEITHAIASGLFKIGDKLPSEAELAAQTGVSRPSVREALGVLRYMGILETRTGDGTYVKQAVPPLGKMESDTEDLFNILEESENPFEILEARRFLEKDLVTLAVERHTQADIVAIEHSLSQLVSYAEREMYDEYLSWDRRYHWAIARAARNVAMEMFLQYLMDNLRRGLWARLEMPLVASSKRHIAETCRIQAGLLDAIKSRDLERCQTLVEEHFDEIDRLVAEF